MIVNDYDGMIMQIVQIQGMLKSISVMCLLKVNIGRDEENRFADLAHKIEPLRKEVERCLEEVSK